MPLIEPVLDPSAAISAGTLYVAVGAALPSPMVSPMYVGARVVIVIPITDTAGNLAAAVSASVIRACDVTGRRDCFANSGLQL